MRIAEMNWMQVEKYLESDDRAVLPLGSTEQHGYLSLMVDVILPEKLAVDATDPVRVPVFPAMPYGLAPYFSAFPGTVTLRVQTYTQLLTDILNSLSRVGFRRILLLNGHGGNSLAGNLAFEWMSTHPGHQVKLHNWWNAPETLAKVREIDPLGTHASWMENFPWTRLPGIELPTEQKPAFDTARKAVLGSEEFKQELGDGSYGGYYQRPDEEMLAIWEVAVREARQEIEGGWA